MTCLNSTEVSRERAKKLLVFFLFRLSIFLVCCKAYGNFYQTYFFDFSISFTFFHFTDTQMLFKVIPSLAKDEVSFTFKTAGLMALIIRLQQS